MIRGIKYLIGMLVMVMMCVPASAQIAVDTIVEKANVMAFYQGNDGKARVSMVITDSNGREREREFVILRKDMEDGGEQKSYVYFKNHWL